MSTKIKEEKKLTLEVIKLAQKGSKKDFLAIYEIYSPKILRFCLYKVRSKHEAEDVASEIWMNIVKSLKNFNFESNFNTWIYSIAKNIIAQYYRTLYANNTESYEEWMEEDKKIKDNNKWFDHDIEENIKENEHIEIFKDTSAESEIKLKDNKVKEALSLLKPKHAKLIELRFLRGYKIKEVAKELRITVSNAKIIQLRALKKLKNIYSKDKNDKK